jgi:hypothetical protein
MIDVGPELQPLFELVQPFFLKLSVLVGGIFGLYFILVVVRVYYERKKVKILHDIRFDLDQMNIHYGLRYSRQKKHLLRRAFNYLKNSFREIKVKTLNHKKINKKKKQK